MSESKPKMMRATGLLIIEALNSNPNGDPDNESNPRMRMNDYGEISPVSFKRKLRDLVDDKEGPVWEAVSAGYKTALSPNEFVILESRGRDRKGIEKEIADKTFQGKYWDGRVFGNTFLEEGSSSALRTGVVQFGLGVSVAPIRVRALTTTNKAGVQEDKDRGMAPLGYRVVEHGVYCMPFFVNPSVASKSGCTPRDIEVLCRVIPYAYAHTASYIRTAVEIRRAWFMEHKSPLGSVSDFELIAAMTPKKKSAPEEPSQSWSDYDVPTDLPAHLRVRLANIEDLMTRAYSRAGA
ncbi:MAG: type I CRISPR-associated protein Cas7 [Acidobacteriota bacterium]|nr:type I CRISPR-associated protein Cas7 [Acidobacteriota bacterium]